MVVNTTVATVVGALPLTEVQGGVDWGLSMLSRGLLWIVMAKWVASGGFPGGGRGQWIAGYDGCTGGWCSGGSGLTSEGRM